MMVSKIMSFALILSSCSVTAFSSGVVRTTFFTQRGARMVSSVSRHFSQSTTTNVDEERCTAAAADATTDPDAQAVLQRVFETDTRPVILFDGVCNLCNNAVNLALDWDPKGKLRFSALQSNVGRSLLQASGRRADDISSIVLVTKNGKAYVKSDAILKITEELTPLSMLPLKPFAVLGRYVVPKPLRDIVYDGVANNRYDLMGKRDQCRFDADGEFDDRFVDEKLALKQ